jgi:hypothetical protein
MVRSPSRVVEFRATHGGETSEIVAANSLPLESSLTSTNYIASSRVIA